MTLFNREAQGRAWMGSGVTLILLGIVAVAAPPDSLAEPPESHTDWSSPGGNSDATYFSANSQITPANIGRLGLKWYADIPTDGGLLGNALVADGVVFQSGARGVVWASDLKSGHLLWTYTPVVQFSGALGQAMAGTGNRGLAVDAHNVYVGTPDCRLTAVDRRTGLKVWNAAVCEPNESLALSGPPKAGGGKVFVGTANMDLGSGRAHVDAYDASTGAHSWRFYTIPDEAARSGTDRTMAMAAATWAPEYWKWASGGSVWDAITYDAELNQLYIGIGSAQPMNPHDRKASKGAELFSDCIVALNAQTGSYVWHYQTTPHDAWDYDATMHIVIADVALEGTKRRVLMTAPKNGFFYVLDAKTGTYISGKNYVPTSWASSIDKKGVPVELNVARYYESPGKTVNVSPSIWGAHNWQAMSYNSELGLVYLPAINLSMRMTMSSRTDALSGNVDIDWTESLNSQRKRHAAGELIAWNPVAQRSVWVQRFDSAVNGGVLSTRGGVVFQGTGDGWFYAYEAKSGQRVWKQRLGSSVQAAPTSVMQDGEQIVLIPSGIGGGIAHIAPDLLGNASYGPDRLFAFSLSGSAAMPSVGAMPKFEKPPAPKPTNGQDVAKGRELFAEKGCGDCHGPDAKRHPGGDVVPDLRRISASTLDDFQSIVLGARSSKGMPVFAGQLTPDELIAIEAFVLEQAWIAYQSQERADSK